jgi:hypothetical protein
MLLAIVIASPWWIRNYTTFHNFIPFRSNFAMELYLGNHEGANGLIMFWDHPFWNDDEMARYRANGEVAYIAEKGKIARQWISEHPARFVACAHSLSGQVCLTRNLPEAAEASSGTTRSCLPRPCSRG